MKTFLLALLMTISLGSESASAEQVSVGHSEGLAHGFLVLRTLEGKTLADGEITQLPSGHLIKTHLVFHFRDGSLYEERAVYSQNGKFRLVSDHLVQKGASFKQSIETSVDVASGRVTCRCKDDAGKQNNADEHMNLPDDVANGLLFTLLRHIKPSTRETIVSEVAMAPQPRLVQLVIVPGAEEPFTIGTNHYKATRYVIKVKIGGIAGLVAPILGKQPPDLHVWIKQGDVPAFIKFEGPVYNGGPVWRVELADAAKFH